jgi:hypothetical protein
LQVADLGVAALGGQGRAGGLLLGFGLGRHLGLLLAWGLRKERGSGGWVPCSDLVIPESAGANIRDSCPLIASSFDFAQDEPVLCCTS